MSVQRTRTGKWEVRWREGSRHRSQTFDLKTDADNFNASVRRRRQFGEPVLRRRDVPTLEPFVADWFTRRVQDHERGGLALNTLRFDSSVLDVYVLPYLGHLSLLDLRTRRLEEWQAEVLADRGSAYMTQRAIALLARILDRAVAAEYLAGNPARVLERPAHRARRGRTASPEQVEAMRTHFLEHDRLGDATLISLLAYGGVRPSEALGARWRNLDGRRLRVELHDVDGELERGTKTGEHTERWLEQLPDPLLADLAEWRLALGRPQGLVFPRASDAMAWRKYDWDNWRRRTFRPAAGAAGLLEWDRKRKRWIGRFVPYDLRHTCASLMIAAGRPIAEVAAHLGHGVDVCARTYAHAMEAMKGQPVRSVEELIREARGEAEARKAAVS
jgi:integrase